MGKHSRWALHAVMLAAVVYAAATTAQQVESVRAASLGRVVGRVVDATGSPASAARVLLIVDSDDVPLPVERAHREMWTDDNGRFAFEQVGAGDYLVIVEIPDAPIPGHHFSVHPGRTRDVGELRTRPAAWLNGRVVDQGGQPISGATVLCTRGHWGWHPIERVRVLSDSGGLYRCGPVAGGEVARIELAESGAEVVLSQWAAPAEGGETDGPTLVYRPGAAIRLSVSDEAGNSILNSYLTLWDDQRQSPQHRVEQVEGGWLHRGIPPGTYELVVNATGFFDSQSVEVELEAGAILDHAVVLGGPARADLTVRVEVEGRDLEGAEINVSTDLPGLDDYREAATDASGRTVFESFPVGPVTLDVSYDGLRQMSERFEVAETGTSRRVVMEPKAPGAVTVHGRLIDVDGAPVAHRVISLKPDYRSSPTSNYEVETDVSGKFVIPFVIESQYRVCMEDYRAGRACFDDVRVAADAAPPDLRLEPPASASLRVRLEAPRQDLPSELRIRRADHSGSMSTTPVGGEYRFPRLTPGTWIVEHSTNDQVYELGRVDVAAGGERHVEYVYESPLRTLKGQVLVDGAPLVGANVAVAAVDDKGPYGWTVSDQQGQFVLEGLVLGEGWLDVHRADGRRMHQQRFALVDDSTLDVEVRTRRLRGRVEDRNGEPVPGARFAAHGWEWFYNHEHNGFTADAAGTFESWDLAEREWQLSVSAPGYRPARLKHTVSLDLPAKDLVVVLDVAAELAVEVEPLEGRVPQSVTVWLCSEPKPCGGAHVAAGVVRPDASGVGVWEDAPEGDWYASIWTGFERRDALPIEVPGEPLRIDRQRPVGNLWVRLPELLGAPIPLTLQLFTPEGHQALGYSGRRFSSVGPRTAFTSPGYGRLHASRLVAAEYLARVTASDGRVWERTVMVEAIEETVIELRAPDLVADPLGRGQR